MKPQTTHIKLRKGTLSDWSAAFIETYRGDSKNFGHIYLTRYTCDHATCPHFPRADSTRSPTVRAAISSMPARQRSRAVSQMLQYRDKTVGSRTPSRRSRCTGYPVRSASASADDNDDVELAAEVGADGGASGPEGDADIVAALRLGNGAIIGVSCYDSLELARDLRRCGCGLSGVRRILPLTDQTTGRARRRIC